MKLVKCAVLLFLFLNLRNELLAQGVDRPVSEQGSVIILETGKLWNNTTQVNYIFRPPFGYNVINLFIRNNSVGLTHSPTITLNETSDALVGGFAGNTSKWNTDQNIGFGACGTLSNGSGTNAISANTTGVCSFILRNAAQVAITFTSDGGDVGSTFDLVLDFSTSGGNNFALIGGVDLTTNPSNPVRSIQVDSQGRLIPAFGNSATNPIFTANGGTIGLINPCAAWTPSAVINSPIHITTATTTGILTNSTSTAIVCGFSLVMTGTGTQTFKLTKGTGGTCTSPSDLTGTYTTSVTTGFLVTGGVIFLPISSIDTACIVTTGTTVELDGYVTYARR